GVPYFGVRTLREGTQLTGFDVSLRTETNMPDIPNLKQSAAPMPRTNKPPNRTPGSVETGQDDDLDAARVPDDFARLCTERGIRFDNDAGYQQLLGQVEAEPPQNLVETTSDEEAGLDDETIKEVMAHLDGRLGEAALEQLEDMLRTGPNPDLDPGMEFDEQERAQLERVVEGKDRHSASDWKETFDDIEGVLRARELMPGDKRRRVARDMPPPFPGRPTPGGAPLPGWQERIDSKQIASDAEFFGVKKRHLKRLARAV